MSSASMARLALLSLAPVLALGQAAHPQPAPEPDGAAESTATAAPGDGTAESTVMAAPGDGAAAAGEEPPDEYEASEQISEDLSVSFPVDI